MHSTARIFLLIMSLLLHQISSASAEGRRVALVIGNAAYQDAKLRNPANDAEDIAVALRGLGFEVVSRRDADQKQMKAAVREFAQKLRGAETGLFYFADHGIQIKNSNYIVPVGADIQSEADTEDQAVSLDYVMRTLEEGGARFNIAILDACRNNPYAKTFRSASRGLAVTQASGGMLIAYATAPGSVAADGEERNGIYTKHLLKNLKEGDSDIQKVFQRVRSGVVSESGGKQTPWETTSLTGEFYFKPGTQVASLEPVPTPAYVPARVKSRDEIEDEYWEAIRESSDVSTFEQYRKAYPKGRYLNTANLKIAQLRKPLNKPAEPVNTPEPVRADNESALWNEAQKGNSRDDYEVYLRGYPKGKYVLLAKSRIKKLQEEAAVEAGRKDKQAWEAASQTGSAEGYQGYLKAYPQGAYALIAPTRLKKVQSDLAAAQQKKREEEVAVAAKQAALAAQQEAERKRKLSEGPQYVTQGGLTWMPVSSTSYTYSQATALCAGTINGQTGWRLPSKDELVALYNSGAMKGLGWTLSGTWSSTPSSAGDHYYVGLYVGGVFGYNDTNKIYVSCVR